MWTKHTNYEQANRVPLLIIAPGVAKPGTSTQQLAETVDIFPTLVELAGLPKPRVPQPLNGVTLVPVLRDPLSHVRDHAYHTFPRQRAGQNVIGARFARSVTVWLSGKSRVSPLPLLISNSTIIKPTRRKRRTSPPVSPRWSNKCAPSSRGIRKPNYPFVES